MNLLERLRLMADAADPAGSITLSVFWLREQLEAEGAEKPAAPQPPIKADLTVPELATVFKRGKSTIRTWLASGAFPNAYLFMGREWRVPAGDVDALQRQQREANRRAAKGVQTESRPAGEETLDLGAWRQHYRKTA